MTTQSDPWAHGNAKHANTPPQHNHTRQRYQHATRNGNANTSPTTHAVYAHGYHMPSTHMAITNHNTLTAKGMQHTGTKQHKPAT